MGDQEGGLGQRTNAQTPLPRKQIRTLLLLDLAEVISVTTFYPYIVELIEKSQVATDRFSIGHYVGIVESLFFLTQAVFGPQWTRLSDRIGRKPVLVIGTLGLGLSMRLFGRAQSFLEITFGRALVAGLNGNSNVVKLAIKELTDKSNRAKAFSFLSLVWFTGSAVTSQLGTLCFLYVELMIFLFNDEFWTKYGFSLPCMVAVVFSLFCCILALFTLHETNPRLRNSRYQPLHSGESEVALLAVRDDQANGILLQPAEPTDGSNLSTSPTIFSFLFDDPARLVLLNYGLLAFLDAAFRVLFPLFLAIQVDASVPYIGVQLARMGLVGFLVQVALFAPAHRRFGSRPLYLFGLGSFGILFATFAFIKKESSKPGLVLSSSAYALVVLQMVLYPIALMPFHIVSLYLEDPSVSNHPMRATDGIVQTTVAIARAFGSASAASLFSLSMQRQGLTGGNLIYYFLGSVTTLVVYVSRMLPTEPWRRRAEGELTSEGSL